MAKILIINGPNLNLLGRRQPDVYGHDTLDDINRELAQMLPDGLSLDARQYNGEGGIIDALHVAGFDENCLGIVLNAGAYTHTSVALHDCIRAVKTPVIEVHISNVHTREEFRHKSMISCACLGVICGFGLDSYRLGVEALIASSIRNNQQ